MPMRTLGQQAFLRRQPWSSWVPRTVDCACRRPVGLTARPQRRIGLSGCHSTSVGRKDGVNGSVLIVSLDEDLRHALRPLLAGLHVAESGSVDAAIVRLGEGLWDVILVDVDLLDEVNQDRLTRAFKARIHTTAYILTGLEALDRALSAMDRFAEGYLLKALHAQEVRAVLSRGIERAALALESQTLREALAGPGRVEGLLGDHPAMQEVLKTIGQVAKSRATILITGETGTGKELIASAIHFQSPRRDKPFVRLNCAALAESLLESELFGHERGAFTGAAVRRAGRFEQAHGGTLFLDEVSEIPMPLQVKLLRFLQERTFERVGGNETQRVDVRVVAATNRDLKLLVEDGRFRLDLFYRLQVVEITVPPLRARPSDIPTLAEHFLKKYAEENDIEIAGFDDEAMAALVAYPWPGNVRELENAIERAVVMCAGPKITLSLVPVAKLAREPSNVGMLIPGLKMAELERIAILKTLEATGGSTRKAAELLEISRRKIQYRLKEWGLEKHDDDDD